MNTETDYIKYIMNELNFPDTSKKILSRVENRIQKDKNLYSEFFFLRDDYMKKEDAELGNYIDKIETLALKYFIHPYTLDFMYILHCSEITRSRYLRKGYTEDFFIEGAKDFRYKLIECMKRTGVVGTFVATWNDNFLKMKRFTLGRFQYEPETSGINYTAKCGIEIHEGDKLINFHIPWSGVSLTDEKRFSSYRAAYDFFKDDLNGKPLILICHSWLIYPRQEEFLNKNSNVLKFMRDFEIVNYSEKKGVGPGWRLYGKDYPRFLLPKRNSLEKAYTEWIQHGNPCGHGTGIIVFDGEKILK